ncbi:MAG: Thymidylate kinase [Syntrophomonadaceae bacterium]|nr:Thymidylate kinase [Bacillota bacterium]
MRENGVLITLEGTEGSGKSTQVKHLSHYLADKGLSTLTTLEPGGTPLGMKLRRILLASKADEIAPLPELFLYLAERAQHVCDVIIPALSEGKIVISDRFLDATVAYQGYGRNLDLTLIEKLNELASQGIKPDLTILLDIEILSGMKRAKRGMKGDRLEEEGDFFHNQVREGYLKIAAFEPERVKVVNASDSMDNIRAAIRKHVDKLLIGRFY